MIRYLFPAIALILFLPGGAYAALPERTYPLTMGGTRHAVTQWLQENGYNYQVFHQPDGLVHIGSINDEQELLVELRPHSPLATEVVIHLDENEQREENLKELLQNLSEKNWSNTNKLTGNRSQLEIPSPILNQTGTAVCIHADNRGQDVQFSGVFIDSRGLVLCTAHDLQKNNTVNITFTNGMHFKGDILKIDFHRDLALIQTYADQEQCISLEKGRNLLGMNERVFSVGCPLNQNGTIHAGFINGLPRMVDDLPLWQVSMEIQPGGSGSPVFDDNGNFVALLKARHRISPGIGFLIPLEVIIDFLGTRFEQ